MVNTKLQPLEQILHSQGLHAALEFLNQQVTHRFTAIYHLNKDSMEIVELVDKFNDPSTAPLSRVPLSQSFCEVAMRDGALVTSNSALDKSA